MNATLPSIGIEHISRQTPVTNIPEQPNEPWRAPAAKPVSHVNELFEPRNIQHQLEEFVRPPVTTWYLLLPYKFRLLREQIMAQLGKGQNPVSPQEKCLKQAAKLLENEKELGDLLDRYRYSLIKA